MPREPFQYDLFHHTPSRLVAHSRLSAATNRERPTKAIPTQATLRPCRSIAPSEGQVVGIEHLYRALTRPLVLSGSHAMKRDHLDDIPALKRLADQTPWVAPLIDLVDDHIGRQVWLGRPYIALGPMLLVGPPGAGKSRLARSLGEALGLQTSSVNLAGVSDSRLIEGTARGFMNTQPCLPAVAMTRSRTANPCIILEEADKAGGSAAHGEPLKTLLTMLEPHTASRYFDSCLLADVDLSHVNWILTANTTETLSRPLLSRLQIVRINGPEPQHFDQLLHSIRADIATSWGVRASELPELHGEAEAHLRANFAANRSMRQLSRALDAAMSASVRSAHRSSH